VPTVNLLPSHLTLTPYVFRSLFPPASLCGPRSLYHSLVAYPFANCAYLDRGRTFRTVAGWRVSSVGLANDRAVFVYPFDSCDQGTSTRLSIVERIWGVVIRYSCLDDVDYLGLGGSLRPAGTIFQFRIHTWHGWRVRTLRAHVWDHGTTARSESCTEVTSGYVQASECAFVHLSRS